MLFRMKYMLGKNKTKNKTFYATDADYQSQLTKNSTESQSNITCAMPTDYFHKRRIE